MRSDWWSCDGAGHERPAGDESFGPTEAARGACAFDEGTDAAFEAPDRPSANEGDTTRRALLAKAALAAVGWAASHKGALSQLAFGPGQERRDTLVVIFLRGGLDGINAIVPYAEDAYYRLRPTLGLAAPRDFTRPSRDRVLDLDGFFGLHPALAPLLPLFREGTLGFVHACGSEDRTRSHFEAMNAMERGLATAKGGASSGWLARYLNASDPERPSPLRAIALTDVMPDSLRGATHASAFRSLSDFRLEFGGEELRAGFLEEMRAIYARGDDEVSEAGRQTLQVLEALRRLDPAKYVASHGADYPKSDLGEALKQVALLIKSDLGLEVACLDKGGWDTHFAQGRSEGILTGLLADLAASLAAFARDLGPEIRRVTVIAMTEFGRRCYENGTLGTDHGRGSVLFSLGGAALGKAGGRVSGVWPGLEASQLEEPGDLKVTTDYRTVLADVLVRRMGFQNVSQVFPGQPWGASHRSEADASRRSGSS